MIDVNVAPYRVEWRPDLSVPGWALIGSRMSRPLADDLALETLEKHGGYCRLIVQHVIAASERPSGWEAAT